MTEIIIPYTILSQGIYTGLITTISSLTNRVCSIIKTIYTYKNPDVDLLLLELDIESKLNMINATLKFIDNYSNKNLSQNISNMNYNKNPIIISINSINDIIKIINDDLNKINLKILNHHNKWFNNWRKMNIIPLLNNLKIHNKVLDMRFDILVKISVFLKNINI